MVGLSLGCVRCCGGHFIMVTAICVIFYFLSVFVCVGRLSAVFFVLSSCVYGACWLIVAISRALVAVVGQTSRLSARIVMFVGFRLVLCWGAS